MRKYYLHSLKIWYTYNGTEYYKVYTKFCKNINQTRLYKNAIALLDDPQSTAYKIEINKN
jgi:hypothetical protein